MTRNDRDRSPSEPRSRPALGQRPVIFGEVLFDVFPAGEEVLGGAAFNVAWNLQGLGLKPLFISRVGDDDRGRRVLDAMRAWGMDASGVQLDRRRSTGVVEVKLSDGQPRFRIAAEQAYDFIDAEAALAAAGAGDGAVLYHGTLAARSPTSRAALFAVREGLGLRVFVDVNLRAPWWSRELVDAALRGASWVKLSDEEIAALAGAGHVRRGDIAAEAERQRAELGLDCLVVTCGADGAVVARSNGPTLRERPPKLDRIEDTVGAGDAFSAVMVLGLCRGWGLGATLTRAVHLAARICAVRGATSWDRDLYRLEDVRSRSG
jgi:fructokinase